MTPEKPDDPISDRTTQTSQNRFSLLSHDLRSALSDIVGGVSLIDPTRLDIETREHFDRIAVAGQALVRLLDKSQIDGPDADGQGVTQASNVNLREFVTDIRKRWGDIARGKGIEFRVDTSPSLPAIITLDRVSLDRVIANLIGNAVNRNYS